MPNRKNRTLFLVIVALIALAVWSTTSSRTKLDITTIQRGIAVDVVYATGIVEPVTAASVAPQVTARLEQFFVEEGQQVKENALLARLDSREQEADTNRFAALVNNDRIELERARTLWQRKTGSQEAFDKAKSILAQDEAQLAAAQERLAQRQLRAPFDGTILRRDGNIGEIVTPATPLFMIGQPDQLRATLDVDEEDIPHITNNQKVLLSADAFPERIFQTRISEITPAGDTTNKSYRVRALLPSDTPLPVGMTVEANLVAQEKHNVLLAPTSAVISAAAHDPATSSTPDQKAVFRVEGHRAILTPITTGITGTSQIEIIDGIKEGTTIIAHPPLTLENGDRITPAQ